MNFTLPDSVKYILHSLHNEGFLAFVTGGAVRDMVMGRTPHDYDISTSATPYEIKKIFSHTIDTGIKHGTVTVIINKTGFEITTFRREGRYSDSRHPESIQFVKNLREDAQRRDFTINAMSYSEESGLIDFFCGKRDINQGIIRCVGNADQRFKEDALRMIRAFRFAAAFGFTMESSTALAIQKYGVLIKRISSERILMELNKILLCDNPDIFSYMHELGMLKHILPQLDKCFGEPQRNKYHIYDVGTHIMHTVKNTRKDLVLRWAALLHDVGKPYTSSTDSNNVIHFYGHHRESRRIANDILHKLRMDSASIHDILLLIENHDVRIEPSPSAVKRIMARTGPELFSKLLELQIADNKSKNPLHFPEKKRRIDSVREIFDNILVSHEPYRISDLVINGRDLIKLGYKPGRNIGDTLKQLTDEIIINPSLNNRKYLLERASAIKKTKSNQI